MSSSIKVTALVVSKKARLAWAFVVKQVAPEFAAIAIMASVAAFLASGPNPNWLNKDLNFGLFYKVLTAAGVRVVSATADSSTSMSLVLPCITINTTALPWSFL
jgi:hypothetical protein